MPQFDEFTAWVTVDGHPATEYATTGDQNRITCYIASEVGKEFKIFWRDSEVRTPTRGVASIDGRSYPPRYIDSMERNRATLASVRDSETSTRPFVFSKINLTDDDNYLNVAAPKGLGDIEIVIQAVEHSQRMRWPQQQRPNQHRSNYHTDVPTVFHERRKKGFDHQANLGASRQLPMFAARDNRPMNSFEKPRGPPIVTFCFKYRPLDMLQAQGFAPRPPPLHPEEDVKPDIIDVDDLPEEPEIQYLGMRMYMEIKDEDPEPAPAPAPAPATAPIPIPVPIPIPIPDIGLGEAEDVKDPSILQHVLSGQNFPMKVPPTPRSPPTLFEPLPDDIRAQMDYYTYNYQHHPDLMKAGPSHR